MGAVLISHSQPKILRKIQKKFAEIYLSYLTLFACMQIRIFHFPPAKSTPILIRMSLCASWREGRPCEELNPPKILIAIFTSLQLFQHATDLFGEKVTVKTRFSHIIPLTIIKQLNFVNSPGKSLLGCKYH